MTIADPERGERELEMLDGLVQQQCGLSPDEAERVDERAGVCLIGDVMRRASTG